MHVELLFWAGCPSHEKALHELRAVLAEEGLDPREVVVQEVATESDAVTERFIGSPTVRVDGIEVQPAPNEPAGLTCRVYTRRDGRISPTPDPEDIRDLVRGSRAGARARAGGRALAPGAGSGAAGGGSAAPGAGSGASGGGSAAPGAGSGAAAAARGVR